jgi:hypothetical protein
MSSSIQDEFKVFKDELKVEYRSTESGKSRKRQYGFPRSFLQITEV